MPQPPIRPGLSESHASSGLMSARYLKPQAREEAASPACTHLGLRLGESKLASCPGPPAGAGAQCPMDSRVPARDPSPEAACQQEVGNLSLPWWTWGPGVSFPSQAWLLQESWVGFPQAALRDCAAKKQRAGGL